MSQITTGDCATCETVFEFDPVTVPSMPLDVYTNLPPEVGGTDPADAVRRPFCPVCAKTLNDERRLLGKETWDLPS